MVRTAHKEVRIRMRNTEDCESIRHGNGYENVPVQHETSVEV